VAKAYGVLRAMGLFCARHTFYVDVDGKILYVDTDVKPNSAGDDLVERLRALGVRHR